jgi:hypothetical protein
VAKETFRIEWEAHEYEHKERTSDWYWAVGIVAVSGAIASIIFGNIIFGILLLISVFSLTLYINRPPEVTHVLVNEVGVLRGSTFYPYSTLHSFYIDEDHPHRKILIRSKKMLMPLIVVPLGEMNADRVHHNLSGKLPEEYLSLPFVEKILEYFGF